MPASRKPSKRKAAVTKTAVQKAIDRAERILPGRPAPEGPLDPRWQVIIEVSEYIGSHPLEVWAFARRWGTHASADLRAAVATCLVEHLLERHFERIIPLVEEACDQSKRFADTVTMCWQFGRTKIPKNQKRFKRLLRQVKRRRAARL
jgi:hypothetical protein